MAQAPAGDASSPLRGLRVLEVGSTLSAPYCSMLLGQLGADVVKVEPPGGDITRHMGPSRSTGMSSMFLALNAAKRSVVLDLTSDSGRRDLRALALDSDVVVHNMRPAAAERAGLAATDLRSLDPALVVCAIQGYPSGSGDEHRPAYDDVVQAGSGVISLQSALTGSPSYVATLLADKTTGMMAALAVLAAVHRRHVTGQGAALEVPMSEVTASVALVEHLGGETFEPALGPALYGRTTSRNRGPYRTADGWLSVTVYTPAHWDRFLAHVGRSHLLRDARFADVASRAANIDALYAILAEELSTATTSVWLGVFEQLDIPASPVRDAREILADRGPGALLRSELHPSEGMLRYLPHPVRYDGRQPARGRPAPRLGEHTHELVDSLPAAIPARQQEAVTGEAGGRQ